MKELIVTNAHRDVAIDNKSCGIIQMPPEAFLSLTVQGTVDRWVEEQRAEGSVFSLDQYNAWASAGKIRVMPFLEVETTTKKVVGHEGRHRAIACVDAGLVLMPVAVILRKNGTKTYYEHPFIDDRTHPTPFKKRYMGIKDVPSVFIGQFNATSVRADLRKWDGFYSEKETKLPDTQVAWATRIQICSTVEINRASPR
jgi:hypothetical protein